jgi:hypothetical protein
MSAHTIDVGDWAWKRKLNQSRNFERSWKRIIMSANNNKGLSSQPAIGRIDSALGVKPALIFKS